MTLKEIHQGDTTYTALQSQKKVTACFTSKQMLLFGSAEQISNPRD